MKSTAIHEKEFRSANEIRFNKHKKRKNNDLVAAMYAMYRSGKSLEEVGEVYRKTRQAVYDVFRTHGYPLRAKELKGLRTFKGFRFTVTKGGYLRGTVRGRRVLMHQFVWEERYGPIPIGHVIHHKDNDPANNALENLELVPRNEMSKRFNPGGRNQFSIKQNADQNK